MTWSLSVRQNLLCKLVNSLFQLFCLVWQYGRVGLKLFIQKTCFNLSPQRKKSVERNMTWIQYSPYCYVSYLLNFDEKGFALVKTCCTFLHIRFQAKRGLTRNVSKRLKIFYETRQKVKYRLIFRKNDFYVADYKSMTTPVLNQNASAIWLSLIGFVPTKCQMIEIELMWFWRRYKKRAQSRV